MSQRLIGCIEPLGLVLGSAACLLSPSFKSSSWIKTHSKVVNRNRAHRWISPLHDYKEQPSATDSTKPLLEARCGLTN